MKNHFFPKEIKLLVSRELFENYEKFRLNWLVERDPNKLWCPTPNCETICYTNSSKTSKNPVAVVCPKVSHLFFKIIKSQILKIQLYFLVQQYILFIMQKELSFWCRLQGFKSEK